MAGRGNRALLQTAMEVELLRCVIGNKRQPSREAISRSHRPCALASAIRANAMLRKASYPGRFSFIVKGPGDEAMLSHAEPRLLDQR